MTTNIFLDVQGRRVVASATSSAAAALPALFRGDTVPLRLVPLMASGNPWAPFVVFDGVSYAVTVRVAAADGSALSTSTAWTWDVDAWRGELVLMSAAIDSALSGASLSVFFEVELSSVVNGATRYETVCQETAQLRRDYITH